MTHSEIKAVLYDMSQHLLNRGQTIFWQESSQLEPCHNTFLIEVKPLDRGSSAAAGPKVTTPS